MNEETEYWRSFKARMKMEANRRKADNMIDALNNIAAIEQAANLQGLRLVRSTDTHWLLRHHDGDKVVASYWPTTQRVIRSRDRYSSGGMTATKLIGWIEGGGWR